MTKEEILSEMQSDSKLNRARRVFSSYWGQIENSQHQRVPLTIFQIRAMEFEAVQKIKEIFNAE
jgi:hypothetical protein